MLQTPSLFVFIGWNMESVRGAYGRIINVANFYKKK